MIQFILGAAVGAAAVYWRSDLRRLLAGELPGVRARAAEQLESIEKNVDAALDGTRSRIRSILRAGQQGLRKPTTTHADAAAAPSESIRHGT